MLRIKAVLNCMVFFVLLITGQLFAGQIEWSTVGNPGNPEKSYNLGRVDSVYQIGKYEVTVGQYVEFLNAVAATSENNLYNSSISGVTRNGPVDSYTYEVTSGWENKPINRVNWYSSVRFANWIHNGRPSGAQDETTTEDGAYDMSGSYIYRKGEAQVFLPTLSEWYKAAFYDPTKDGTGGYWYFATQNDWESQPVAEAPPGGTNSANYKNIIGDVTDVGAYINSLSYYGTYDQSGNLWEWTETTYPGNHRYVYGGCYENNSAYYIGNNLSSLYNHAGEIYTAQWRGFRLASVENFVDNVGGNAIPEPLTIIMLITGIIGWYHRKKNIN